MGVFSSKGKIETYTYVFLCDNCDNLDEQDVPLGNRVEVFGKKSKCNNCGCILWPDGKKVRNQENEEEEE